MIVDQYEKWFLGLRQYSSYHHDEALLKQHFFRGLRDSIIGDFHVRQSRMLAYAMEKEIILERNFARGFSRKLGSQNQSAHNLGHDTQFTQCSGKGQTQLASSKGGHHHGNRQKLFWTKGGQSLGTSGKKGDDQNQGQKSQQDHPPQSSQQNSSKVKAPYSSATQGGHGIASSFAGNYYSCGQPSHKAFGFPIKPCTRLGRGVARLEPIVGDARRSH